MQIAVYDTYVTRKDGAIMHFDILVPDGVTSPDLVYQFGRRYLAGKGQAGQPLTATECRLCHVEQPTPEVLAGIDARGYYIIEMQNCT